jgi:hypothetical protein
LLQTNLVFKKPMLIKDGLFLYLLIAFKRETYYLKRYKTKAIASLFQWQLEDRKFKRLYQKAIVLLMARIEFYNVETEKKII